MDAAARAELDRVDEFTTNIANDLDRLAGQIEGSNAEVAAAIRERADKLKLVADKNQEEIVPDAPPPVA